MTRALMIAAPRSGSGRTTVTLGLLRAFKRRGVDVVGLKSGPESIRPSTPRRRDARASISIPGR
jgi:cobyrinic acid a,c-diamide synthase